MITPSHIFQESLNIIKKRTPTEIIKNSMVEKVRGLEERLVKAEDMPSMDQARAAAAELKAQKEEKRSVELESQIAEMKTAAKDKQIEMELKAADLQKRVDEKAVELEKQRATMQALQEESAAKVASLSQSQMEWRETAQAKHAAHERKFSAIQKEIEKNADGKKLWKSALKTVEAADASASAKEAAAK
eukprot:TRINITY_DN37315_c0_g1_i2.p1 TRINITY_DN37315_c0_g1~~TRINITY_DN37315_c0_g1_i2.p1  ORF type:complete len:189 (-),score=76.17 TRINITY_DN37315_c0_g1_i2:133-699(-)